MISLVMTPEVVNEPTWESYEAVYQDSNGNTHTSKVKQPFFEALTSSTTVSLKVGAKAILSGGTLSRDKKSFYYTFICARMIDTEGNETEPWEPEIMPEEY